MNFRDINRFNVIVNALSGNFLPLNDEKTSTSFVIVIYIIFTWFILITFLVTVIIGLVFFTPTVKSVQDGGALFSVVIEILVVTVYMSSQHECLRKLIRKINGFLVESDELRMLVRNITNRHMKRLKICAVLGVGSCCIFFTMPIVNIFEKKHFIYDDFAIPAYLMEAPFDLNIFLIGLFLQTIGNVYIFIKKNAIDVYVSYLVTILTAEYKYVGEQLTETLRQEHDDNREISVIENLRKCVTYHTIVIETGQMLSGLLSINIGVIYIGCILRFCFLAFTFITSDDYLTKSMYAIYAAGSFAQVYMLCSCIQELLEASTSVTDDAFYENWYQRGQRVKSIFRSIGLGNEIECRLTAYRIVDLSVPTFVSIMKQAYSICVLVMRMK